VADNTKRILRLHTNLARVMADNRFEDGRRKGPELRQLVIAYTWARFEIPGPDDDQVGKLHDRILVLAGLAARLRPSIGFRELIRADAPRFEPPGPRFGGSSWGCPSLMTRGPRAGESCGKRPSLSFRVTDPATGEWEDRGWCTRHRVDADQEWAAERGRVAAGVPTPLPNVGGLLPCYIRASNWPDLYESASIGWTPPEIGIVADDWPVLAKVHEHAPPQLKVLDGDSETDDDVVAVPRLRLVT
jgi:hypothetical protein